MIKKTPRLLRGFDGIYLRLLSLANPGCQWLQTTASRKKLDEGFSSISLPRILKGFRDVY